MTLCHLSQQSLPILQLCGALVGTLAKVFKEKMTCAATTQVTQCFGKRLRWRTGKNGCSRETY